jgi:hypothetical protein
LTASLLRGTVASSATGVGTAMRARLAVLALALATFASAKPASAANWLEKNFWMSGPEYTAEVPLCEDDQILARIQSRFAQKEREYWNSELKIVGWEYIRERAFMPWHYAAIPRRFCTGKVHVNDGTVHRIHYSIAEDTGIIGATWGVEWCVDGYDRNWAYASPTMPAGQTRPSCKEAGP